MSLARDGCTLVEVHTSDTAVSKLDVMMIQWAIVGVLHGHQMLLEVEMVHSQTQN